MNNRKQVYLTNAFKGQAGQRSRPIPGKDEDQTNDKVENSNRQGAQACDFD